LTIYVNARAIVERDAGDGVEILLQVRSREGEPERWELPGGQIGTFEPVFRALEREVLEETGLTLTRIVEQGTRLVHENSDATTETFEPFFVYQTLEGPVDSLGFSFRCHAVGEINCAGDDARQPTWFPVSDLARRLRENPDQFDWLTQAALERYVLWRREECL
jgi:8-oxo-dGTP diphosphatase